MSNSVEVAPIEVEFSELTGAQARTWLAENDPEGIPVYDAELVDKDLVDAVEDNLASYGIKNQSGSILITSDFEGFQDENIPSLANC